VTTFDKFLLCLWSIPVVVCGVACLIYAGLDTSRRRAAVVGEAARRMNLPLSPELGEAVTRRIRIRYRTMGWVALAAAIPGAAAIVLLWRHTHAIPVPTRTITPEDLIFLALAGIVGLGDTLGWRRSLRCPLTGSRDDLAPHRLAPHLGDVLPRWFRWQQRVALLFPVAAVIVYLDRLGPHPRFTDLGVCLGCLAAIGVGLRAERWQAQIMSAPQPAGAQFQELAADDTMRVEFVLTVAWLRFLYLELVALAVLDAAPVPLAWQQWQFLVAFTPFFVFMLLWPGFKSKHAQRLLLWHRRWFAEGYADLAPLASQ
jgi:hypothetical protein